MATTTITVGHLPFPLAAVEAAVEVVTRVHILLAEFSRPSLLVGITRSTHAPAHCIAAVRTVPLIVGDMAQNALFLPIPR